MPFCCICKKESDHFLPFGPSRRPNVRCPGCGSGERHRLVGLWLQKQAKSFASLLHIAPNNAMVTALQPYTQKYVCGDLEPQNYRQHKATKIDATKMSTIGDNEFDCVVMSHVFEHIPRDVDAMKECFRILCPEGTLLAMVPQNLQKAETHEDPSIVDPRERVKYFGQADHVRMYGQDFSQRLMSVGFLVDIVAPQHMKDIVDVLAHSKITTIATEDALKCRLADEILFVCRKPAKQEAN